MDNLIKTPDIPTGNKVSNNFQSYCTLEDSSEFIKNRFNFMHLNVRGLYGKQSDIRDLLSEIEDEHSSIDVLGLCETHLNDFSDKQINISGYEKYSKHRSNKKGGGVAIFIKKYYESKLVKCTFIESIFEAITVEIKINKKEKILCSEIYRAPNTNVNEFLYHYENHLKTIHNNSKYKHAIGMDQNLDLIKIDHNLNTTKFLDINLETGFIPTILLPTQITHSSATLIDNIFIDSLSENISKSCILDIDISDHLPCIISLEVIFDGDTVIGYFRDLSSRNLSSLMAEIEGVEFNDCINNSMDINECINLLTKRINKTVDLCCPEREIEHKKHKIYQNPWMTKGLIKSLHNSHKKYSKIKTLPPHHLKRIEYNAYRNVLNRTKKRAKITHFENLIDKAKGNSAKLWNIINIAINKTSNKQNIPSSFLIEGKLTADAKLISNHFAKHYAGIGKRILNKIGISSKSHMSYLNKPLQENFFASPTNIKELECMINEMPDKNSCGEDRISNKILKLFKDKILEVLVHCINRSLKDGVFPDIFKHAIVKPLYKS